MALCTFRSSTDPPPQGSYVQAVITRVAYSAITLRTEVRHDRDNIIIGFIHLPAVYHDGVSEPESG